MMHVTHGLRRALQSRPDEVAYVADGHVRTWRQFGDRIARAASGLQRLGVRRGDRVSILAENTAAFFELYMAAPWSGAIMSSLNTRWSVPELVESLDDSGADILLVDRGFAHLADDLRRARPSIREVIFADEGAVPAGMRGWEELIAENMPVADAERGRDEVVYLFYTGGTTGRAKGVMLTPYNLCTAGLTCLPCSGISPKSRMLHASPFFHMAAGGLIMHQLMGNASCVIVRRFDIDPVLQAVEQHRVTHVVWIPTMLNLILSSEAFDRTDVSSLERVLYGAAPMPPSLVRKAQALMPGTGFTQYYGMTETSGTGVTLPPDEHDCDGPNSSRLGSVGRPVPGAELKIVDADGNEVGPGVVGEICLKGAIVTPGYWQQPERTAEALRDGWMHTGDGGYIDEQGYLFLVDRIKDMIITGGENVYSTEVENAVYSHTAVKECAVIGLADDKWGERVTAVVHLHPGRQLTEPELVAHCRRLIGGYKLPRQVIFCNEPLPKSGAGKILKSELRRAFREASVPAPTPAG